MATRTLDTLFSGPRPVSLGGRVFLVGELRVADMAEMHAAANAGRPDPLAGVRDWLAADYVPPGERHRFADAFDRDEGEEDDHAASPVAGAFTLLRVALRRHHPGLTAGELYEILGAMTAAEYHALHEAAYRPNPDAVLTRALERLAGTLDDDEGDGPDWHEWVDRASRSHGLPYEAVAGMTLTQFFNALNEGKSARGRANLAAGVADEKSRRWKAWFRGDDPETKGGA